MVNVRHEDDDVSLGSVVSAASMRTVSSLSTLNTLHSLNSLNSSSSAITSYSLSTQSTPHLIIKPVNMPHYHKTGSPLKSQYQNKLLLGNKAEVKTSFEILHSIDQAKRRRAPSAMALNPVEPDHKLVSFKHPYLAIKGMKHIPPDAMSLALGGGGGSKGRRRRDKSAGGGSLYSLQEGDAGAGAGDEGGPERANFPAGGEGGIRYVPAHPLTPLPWFAAQRDVDEVMDLLQMRGQHNLGQIYPATASQQLVKIRSQGAIKEAFEGYVRSHPDYRSEHVG
ncbi:hypothetical protein B484DRAFT_456535 [Ochromonadaceae sp. CCMP2298]|nr:hypothetical protein B484DRAFT_456535 [Ochromonadaceae sp. CCMP2298]